jgi:peptidoglycan/LPS O-acetylase OafA/YrhL
VAVAVVVAEHVTGRPTGGFVGVDVFFVLSGFLITGLLLKEADRTGHVSLASFWRRRAKRILPASLVVLVVGTVASWALLGPGRTPGVLADAAWSSLSVANWHFAAQGTDYFASQGPVSPFQHYWSLAVEEQFYLVWPLVVVVLVAGARRCGRGTPRLALGAVLAVVGSASFALALAQTPQAPTLAYFSTATRAWELAAGGLLATCAAGAARLPAWCRPLLAVVGLAGIAVAALGTDPAAGFPAPGALLPVVSTLLVLAAGTGAVRPPRLGPLTTRPVLALGDLSYSVYLWHFVVLVLATALLGDEPSTLWPVVVVATLLLSVISYHLVERPLIDSPLFSADPAGTAWRAWRRRHARVGVRGGVAVLVTACLVAVALALGSTAPVTAPPPLLEVGVASASGREGGAAGTGHEAADPGDEPDAPLTAAWREQIRAALQATTWPTLQPTIEAVLEGARESGPRLACGDAEARGLSREDCTFGAADGMTVVLVGDSTAMHWVDALADLAEAPGSGWQLVVQAKFACPFIDLTVENDVARNIETCRTRKQAARAVIAEMRPDVVLVTNSYQDFDEVGAGPVTPARWAAAFEPVVAELSASAGSVAVLAPPPDDADIASCYTRVSTPADCISRPSSTWHARATSDRATLEAVGGHFVDTLPVTCLGQLCPAFVGTAPVKQDRVHLTRVFQQAASPVLGELLRAEGVIP